jgi:hypothetical protein
MGLIFVFLLPTLVPERGPKIKTRKRSNNMKPHLLVSLAVLMAAVAGFQCKKNDSSPTGPSTSTVPSQVVGTWTFQSATLDGSPTDLATILQWESSTVRAQFVMTSNSSFTYRELGFNDSITYYETGTFTLTGQILKMTATSANGQQISPPYVTSWTLSVTGGTMTLSQTVQQKVVVMTLSSGSSSGTIPSQLVGTWKYQSATVAGSSLPLATALSWVTGTVRAELILSANGAITYREINASGGVTYTSSGTAAASGQAVRITITSENGQSLSAPIVTDYSWSMSGTTLTVSMQLPQGMLVFTLTR